MVYLLKYIGEDKLVKKSMGKALVLIIVLLLIGIPISNCALQDVNGKSSEKIIKPSSENYQFVSNYPNSIEEERGIVWDVQLDFDETSGKYDYVIFGEATDANDGPPQDAYDWPKPPAPFPPCVYAWFNDSLDAPYDVLLKDYRGYNNMNYKQWNLSVLWIKFTGGSTNINISWDSDDIDDSEYDSVILYYVNNNVETDMLTNSYFEFNCPAMNPQEFTINCTIEVNQPPVASFTYEPTDPETIDIIYFNSTSTDSDGTIVNWTWDFDDGSYGYGEQVTHQYNDDGSYEVELTVTDDDGATDNDIQTVSVSNTPPVADFNFEPTDPTTSETIYFNSTSTDYDGTIVNWTWDFDDGIFGYGEQVTHQYGDNGAYDVELTVTDDDGATDSDTQEVNVDNIPPVAVDDDAQTPEDTSVVIDVVDNDYDVDGEVDPTTVDIIDDVNHGETSINPSTGEVTYTPDPDYHGSDSFTYTVDDDDGGTSNEADVDIIVNSVNDPPVAVDDSASTPENTPVLVDVLSNDFDIDNEIDETTVTIVDDAIHGDTSVDPNNGVVTYTPDEDFHGSDSFTYTVKDEDGAKSNKAIVEVNVLGNLPPEKPNKPSGQTRGKWGVEYTYKSSTTDPDGDLIYYLFDWGDGTDSGWVGPYTSGTTAEAKHSWTKDGWTQSYQIKVKAKDENNLESSWSDFLPITMPKVYNSDYSESLKKSSQTTTRNEDNTNSLHSSPMNLKYNPFNLLFRSSQIQIFIKEFTVFIQKLSLFSNKG